MVSGFEENRGISPDLFYWFFKMSHTIAGLPPNLKNLKNLKKPEFCRWGLKNLKKPEKMGISGHKPEKKFACLQFFFCKVCGTDLESVMHVYTLKFDLLTALILSVLSVSINKRWNSVYDNYCINWQNGLNQHGKIIKWRCDVCLRMSGNAFNGVCD